MGEEGLEFDRRLRLGSLLVWWTPRNVSIHIGGLRLIWIRDARRWPLLFSERNAVYTGVRFKKIGPWVIRAYESTAVSPTPVEGDE